MANSFVCVVIALAVLCVAVWVAYNSEAISREWFLYWDCRSDPTHVAQKKQSLQEELDHCKAVNRNLSSENTDYLLDRSSELRRIETDNFYCFWKGFVSALVLLIALGVVLWRLYKAILYVFYGHRIDERNFQNQSRQMDHAI